MTDMIEFVFKILPGLIGLGVVAYVLYSVYSMKAHFFEAMRSWAILMFTISLAALWVLELLKNTAVGWPVDADVSVDLTFTVVLIWISLFAVSLATTYSRFNAAEQFAPFLKKEPLNLMTGWGLVGLALIVAVWATGMDGAEGLKKNTWVLIAVSAYIVSTIALDIALPLTQSRKGKMPKLDAKGLMDMVLLALAWVGIPSIVMVFDVILRVSRGFDDYNPYGWIMVGLFIVMARAVKGTGFLVITVDAETETHKRDGFRSFDIPRGVYLIYDDKADSAFNLFSELVSLPLRPDAKIPVKEDSASATLEFLIPKGLVVTREFPDGVRTKHNLQVTPIIWLTESPGERRIAPTSLAVLTDTLIRFMETNPNSIVLIEGIEYITTFNEFRKILRSLDSLNETTWITKTRLLVAVHPKAFEEKDLALLERDRIVLRGSAGIEELKRESMMAGAPA